MACTDTKNRGEGEPGRDLFHMMVLFTGKNHGVSQRAGASASLSPIETVTSKLRALMSTLARITTWPRGAFGQHVLGLQPTGVASEHTKVAHLSHVGDVPGVDQDSTRTQGLGSTCSARCGRGQSSLALAYT
jgi:hypothetical protein